MQVNIPYMDPMDMVSGNFSGRVSQTDNETISISGLDPLAGHAPKKSLKNLGEALNC